jgi:hypothetical protein
MTPADPLRARVDKAVAQAMYKMLCGDSINNQSVDTFMAHFLDAILPIIQAERHAEARECHAEYVSEFGHDTTFAKWLEQRIAEGGD